ncbi:hypothetical protein [Streptomyces sp. NPDC058595]|uniref:hypothetical protein n=1 Tax=Streptomyces sp. NPDC058595 TaxID=3346550 RepID=UPI003664E86E
MSVHTFRARIRPERIAEMEEAGEKMFAAIEAARPEGVRYAWTRLDDGESYVFVVEFENGDNTPLLAVPAFKEVMARLKSEWISEPLVVERLTPIGSYKLF